MDDIFDTFANRCFDVGAESGIKLPSGSFYLIMLGYIKWKHIQNYFLRQI